MKKFKDLLPTDEQLETLMRDEPSISIGHLATLRLTKGTQPVPSAVSVVRAEKHTPVAANQTSLLIASSDDPANVLAEHGWLIRDIFEFSDT